MRHRLLMLVCSLTVLLGTLAWSPSETGAQDQLVRVDPPANALPVAPTVQTVAATPLRDFGFYPPPTTGTQPLRLLVVLHGMGGNGPDMAAGLLDQAHAQGWAVLAPTMPYRDFRDPELVRQDGALLPRLKALIDALPARTGLSFEPKVTLFGFSRGSQEAIRFSLMFPEATLGVAGLSAGSYTLPSTMYKATASDPARLLPYPYGTGDVAKICGRAFDADAARRVAYWIGVGSRDDRVEDVPRQWDQYVGDDRVERAKRYVEVLQQFGAEATFQLFPNAGHEVTDTMRADAVRFLASLPS